MTVGKSPISSILLQVKYGFKLCILPTSYNLYAVYYESEGSTL